MKFPIIATLAVAFSGAVALPTANTTDVALEKRSTHMKVNCHRICHDPYYRNEEACRTVCHKNENDRKERLDEKQAIMLIDTLFKQHKPQLFKIKKWKERAKFLQQHAPAYFDTKWGKDSGKHHDKRHEHRPEKRLRHHIRVNCKLICDPTQSHGRPGPTCNTACNGKEKKEHAKVYQPGIDAIINAYFGGYKQEIAEIKNIHGKGEYMKTINPWIFDKHYYDHPIGLSEYDNPV